MKIQISDVITGEITKQFKPPMRNRTYTYLLPCLRRYGEDFIKMYTGVLKLAIGLKDVAIGDQYQQHFFILLDSRVYKKNFLPFLNWIREQDYYQDDYVFGDIKVSPCHMIVVKFPQEYINNLPKFEAGKYSELYSEDEVHELFANFPEAKKVLLKERLFRIKYVRNLNKEFGTHLSTDDYEGELDKRPVMLEEYFE